MVVSWANAWHRGRCSVLASHGSARLKHGELGAQEAAGVAGGQVHAQGAGGGARGTIGFALLGVPICKPIRSAREVYHFFAAPFVNCSVARHAPLSRGVWSRSKLVGSSASCTSPRSALMVWQRSGLMTKPSSRESGTATLAGLRRCGRLGDNRATTLQERGQSHELPTARIRSASDESCPRRCCVRTIA